MDPDGNEAERLFLSLLRAQLINTRGMSVVFEEARESFGSTTLVARACEMLEDIANAYLDVSDQLRSYRPNHGVAEFCDPFFNPGNGSLSL